jgi:hypothetical protein
MLKKEKNNKKTLTKTFKKFYETKEVLTSREINEALASLRQIIDHPILSIPQFRLFHNELLRTYDKMEEWEDSDKYKDYLRRVRKIKL